MQAELDGGLPAVLCRLPAVRSCSHLANVGLLPCRVRAAEACQLYSAVCQLFELYLVATFCSFSDVALGHIVNGASSPEEHTTAATHGGIQVSSVVHLFFIDRKPHQGVAHSTAQFGSKYTMQPRSPVIFCFFLTWH